LTLYLVDESILKKFPRINLVYTVNVFLLVVLMHAVIVIIIKN
jgi:hypothetical protein